MKKVSTRGFTVIQKLNAQKEEKIFQLDKFSSRCTAGFDYSATKHRLGHSFALLFSFSSLQKQARTSVAISGNVGMGMSTFQLLRFKEV